MIVSIAGNIVGETDDCVVRYDDVEKKAVAKIRVKGRWVYVRKCQRDAEIAGIAIPDKSRYDNNVCVVLAIGVGCGKRSELWKRKSKAEKHMVGNVAHLNFDCVKVTDQVILPHDHTFGIKMSPYDDEEFFVSETVVEANIKR